MIVPDGGLAYDLARLSGGAALALALVFILQQRFQARVATSGLQAWAASFAAACQGWAQGQGALVIAAAVVLAVNGLLLPAALARAAGQSKSPGTAAPEIRSPAILLLSVLIVAVIVLAAQPAGLDPGADLVAEISAVLLGLAGMITVRSAFQQAAGLLAMENGLVLLATGLPHLPFAATLTVAVVALGALGVLFLTMFGEAAGMDGLA